MRRGRIPPFAAIAAAGTALVIAAAIGAYGLRPASGQGTEGGVRSGDDPDAAPLVIYTPHPTEIAETITREFRQKTGIPILLVQEGTGELMSRLVSGEAPRADVFWGGGVESLEAAADYFEPYISEADPSIRTEVRSPGHRWNPFSVLPVVIVYNETLVPSERVPETWADLLDPWFENRIIMADPEKSGSAYTTLLTMLSVMAEPGEGTFGGWNYVNRLIAQLGPGGIASSSSLVYSSVASGDFFAGITFENYALALQKSGTNLRYCFPKEGTSAVPDGIALVKNAQNREEAEAFIDFALGKDVQTIMRVRWERRPIRPDADAKGSLPIPKTARYPVAEAARNREAILGRWRDSRGFSSPGTPEDSSR